MFIEVFNNDTPNKQVYDRLLSWLGTGLVTIPLPNKYMTAHSPGLATIHLALIYLFVRGIVTKPVPSQESERSYIFVRSIAT
jgi:hypothetical protein